MNNETDMKDIIDSKESINSNDSIDSNDIIEILVDVEDSELINISRIPQKI